MFQQRNEIGLAIGSKYQLREYCDSLQIIYKTLNRVLFGSPRNRQSRMLFEYCAECQSCCNVDPGHPPLDVSLTNAETSRFTPICIEDRCEHLGNAGCTLGDSKPFSCSLYPLSFDPAARAFSFDAECPLKDTYFSQLRDPNSEASHHLARMSDKIHALETSDPEFLKANHAVDIDYFDLIPLPKLGASKRRAK
jgi:Fe-S-cluster containining protein